MSDSTNCIEMAEIVANDSSSDEETKKENEAVSQELFDLVTMAADEESSSVAHERIRHLISEGADPNFASKTTGETILHKVAANWGPDLAELISERIDNFDMLDKHKRTPLHAAATTNNSGMAQWLLKHGANLEMMTASEHQTPLHYAARFDAIETIDVLLHAGANLEARDYRRRTPLHLAIDLCRSHAAYYLISMPIPAQIRVKEKNGDMAMSSMIKIMPNVAIKALDQLHKIDRYENMQSFILAYLEPDVGMRIEGVKSPFATAVVHNKGNILLHPVMQALLEAKWKHMRFYFLIHVLVYILFLLSWSALFVYPSVQEQHIYKFPGDIYRFVLQFIVLVIFALMILEQTGAISTSIKKQWQYRKLCKKKAEEEFNTLILSDKERDYMEEPNLHPTIVPDHAKEVFTLIELVTNILIMIVIVMHIADIRNHTRTLASWVARIACFTTILLWFRLIKYMRAIPSMGILISVIFKIKGDIFRYFLLATIIYIPYVLCFWVIYGGQQYANNTEIATSTVKDLSTPYHIAVMAYRITLIDSYPYDDLRLLDDGMTIVLITPFLLIMAVVGLNLFIALLSNTFQNVQDEAHATSLLQRATLINDLEEQLFCECVYTPYYNFIWKKANPLVKRYEEEDVPSVVLKTEEKLPEYKESDEDYSKWQHDVATPRKIATNESAPISDEPKMRESRPGGLTKTHSHKFSTHKGKKTSHKEREWKRKLKSTTDEY